MQKELLRSPHVDLFDHICLVLGFWEDVNIEIVKCEENEDSNFAKLKGKTEGLYKKSPLMMNTDEKQKI